MKKVLSAIALILAFAKYECAQNAAAPRQEQQQQIPNTITIGNVILKFENNKWYSQGKPLTNIALIELFSNILDENRKLWLLTQILNIIISYDTEIIKSLAMHCVKNNHFGIIPSIGETGYRTSPIFFLSGNLKTAYEMLLDNIKEILINFASNDNEYREYSIALDKYEEVTNLFKEKVVEYLSELLFNLNTKFTISQNPKSHLKEKIWPSIDNGTICFTLRANKGGFIGKYPVPTNNMDREEKWFNVPSVMIFLSVKSSKIIINSIYP